MDPSCLTGGPLGDALQRCGGGQRGGWEEVVGGMRRQGPPEEHEKGHESCRVLPLSRMRASCRPADTAEGTSAAGATSLSMGRPLPARLSKVFRYLNI